MFLAPPSTELARVAELMAAPLVGVPGTALVVCDEGGMVVHGSGTIRPFGGLPPSELVGRRLEELELDYDFAVAVTGLRAALAGEVVALEAPAGRDTAPLALRFSPVGSGRAASGAFLVAREAPSDTDSVSRLREQLERCEQDFQHFTYVTSHDLSEPLRVMSGYSDMLDRRYGDQLDDRGRRYTSSIVAGAGRMSAMIEALLGYSRARSRELAPEATCLQALLGDELVALSRELDRVSAVVTHDRLPEVLADAQAMREVFRELLVNAITFCDRPPRIHVSARALGRKWEISVRDNGIGMAPGRAHRAFDVLARLNPREEFPGVGIGLSIARELVRRHGGEFAVRTEPDAGSTFTFTLPREAIS